MSPFLILVAGMAAVVGSVLLLRMHAFLALLFGALVVAFLTPAESVERFALDRGMSPGQAARLAETSVGERVAEGFGRTCGQIGIVIAMAAIIGVCLLESGAADRIVRSALRLVGERRSPEALLGSGFLLAIPVFFDTVFYLMIPLAKALRLRTGKNYLLYVLAIVAGGTMAHSLVPPTPGPLFVAGELGVDVGLLIVAGLLVGIFTSAAGFGFALWANRRWTLPLREPEESIRQLEELSLRPLGSLPPLWLSLLPILLPLVLISSSTAMRSLAGVEAVGSASASLWGPLLVLGDKNIALALAAAVALLMLLRATSGGQTVEGVKKALSSAGVIILITGGGGAFGTVLQQTGIGAAVREMALEHQLAVLPLVFFLTAFIRTAQGSATVAMITAAGVFSGMAQGMELGFHPLYVVLAIGCGSKPVWWMNDSGFWVVSQMSGMTVPEALRILTPLSVIIGLVGLLMTLLGAWLVPLV